MKINILNICLSLCMVFYLSGCGPANPTTQPTQIKQITTPTVIWLKPTLLPTPILSITPTPIDTLEPGKANEMIKTLLREPVDCSAPCFWGIVPGRTSPGEVRFIFNHFGLQPIIITYQSTDFYNVDYNLDSELSISVNLPIQNNIVQTITVFLHPELQKTGSMREWLAYSPETLIKRYGMPSQVNFVADWGPTSFFSMRMYFDQVDLIVEYAGQDIIPRRKSSSKICPLAASFGDVSLWMGKNPRYPPGLGVPLEKVTSLTIDEFTRLMTGDPKQACFTFNGDTFP